MLRVPMNLQGLEHDDMPVSSHRLGVATCRCLRFRCGLDWNHAIKALFFVRCMKASLDVRKLRCFSPVASFATRNVEQLLFLMRVQALNNRFGWLVKSFEGLVLFSDFS